MILEGRSLQFDMIYVYREENGRGGNGEIIMKMGVANRSGSSPCQFEHSQNKRIVCVVWPPWVQEIVSLHLLYLTL